MHIRIKFGKAGAMKFIGHLDVMRYFQKAIRRAGIDIKYSGGFNPHMIMSFASPLGVGVTSSAEYFDIEVNESLPSAEAVRILNEVMAEGMTVYSYREIPGDKKNKAMSLVAAADYTVKFRDGYQPESGWQDKLLEYCGQDEIILVKKTKKSEREIDIKPFIYKLDIQGGEVHLQLAAGSVNNIKPDLVMEGFAAYMGVELHPFALVIHRDEMYADQDGLISLENLGEVIHE